MADNTMPENPFDMLVTDETTSIDQSAIMAAAAAAAVTIVHDDGTGSAVIGFEGDDDEWGDGGGMPGVPSAEAESAAVTVLTEDDEEERFADLAALVDDRKWIDLRRALALRPPPEAADFVNTLDSMDRTLVIRFLPRHFAADVFAELPLYIQDEILAELSNTEIRNLLADLDPDDRAALMDEMPADMTRKLLNLLSPQDLKLTRELLGYPENSVGRIMTPNVVYIKENWTVREALAHIRKFGHDSETINVVYITDASGKLIDDITLSQLIMASPDDAVSSVMDYNFMSIGATDSQEEAVEKIKKYNYFALPVVDSAGVLLGIVTVDDLMDIAETHATEDFHRIGAVSVEAEDGPIEDLKAASVTLLYKRRIIWLVVLVFVSIFSGAAIAIFEDTIQAIPVLVFFLTFLIGSGGNTGSQASTLMVRALATGDVLMKDWRAMLSKEMLVASALGGVMAGAAGVLGIFRGGFTGGFGGGFDTMMGIKLAAVVTLSMFLIVIVGSLIGMSLPFALKKFGKDPAMASAPLVASIADIVGIIIYFSIATTIL